MQLSYFITDTENSHIKNDEGIELFVCDFVIHDKDRREESGNLYVLDNWQAIFTLDDEKSTIEGQKQVAETAMMQTNRYIECYKLLKLRGEIASKQLEHINAPKEDAYKTAKFQMSEVQKNLLDYDREYRTILYVMGHNKLGIDDLSIEWIADNMISQVLLPGNVFTEYFEAGCLCILTGRIEKQPPNDPNAEQYYLDNCTCSRHPHSASRECWDKQSSLSHTYEIGNRMPMNKQGLA